MTVRITELTAISADLAQADILPVVDLSAGETKKVSVANLMTRGISGAPSFFIDLAKLNPNSTTKLSATALANTGVASGIYGAANTVPRLTINSQGLVIAATGVPISIAASGVSGLAPVATSGTYASLTGLPTLGSLSSQNAESIVVSGGTISGVTFVSGNVTISGGTITGITDLAVADGGTGASTASGARANLGLVIGTNVQAYSSVLSGVANNFNVADTIVYASASGVVSSSPFTSFGRSIISGSTASAVRDTLGLGSIAVQDSDSVSITGGTISGITFSSDSVNIGGGTISGITDLAIADGGTGSSTASGARANLGLAIGTDVQAYSNVLAQVASRFDAAGTIIYASASGVASSTPLSSFGRSVISGSSASGVRSTLGLGDIATQNAGSIVISGGTISGVTFASSGATITGGTITGITDLAIADGGTGASNASDARANLGLTIGTNVQAYSNVLTDISSAFNTANVLVYSSASGVVQAATVGATGLAVISGASASGVRSTIGLGTIAIQDANSVAITGGTISGVTLVTGNATISGGSISGIADLAIADGGTGASTASGARTNLGLAIGTNVQAYSSALSNINSAAIASDLTFYTTASGAVSATPFSSVARTLVAATTISGMRSALGLGAAATLNEIIVSSGNISIDAITSDAILDGSVTGPKIAPGAVSYSKMAATSQSDILLGRATASGGIVEEIPCTAAARSILDDASIADIRATLGLGTLAVANGSFSGTSTGTNTGDQTITLTGDVSGTGTGTFAATIAENTITEAKIANGAVTTNKVGSGAITSVKLANNSSCIVEAGAPAGSGTFIGQQWFNENNSYEYVWTGSAWTQQAAITSVTVSGDIIYDFVSSYPDDYTAVITPSFKTQVANHVFIGPASGSDAAPTFRALAADDLPAATASAKGAVYPGAGLAMTGAAIGHTNAIASGTFYKVQVDGQGHVSSGAASLVASDIPALDASTITTGTFGSTFIADDAITATKLADYSTTRFGEAAPSADFTGQFFFNPLQKDLFLWDGNVWNPVGISIGEIVFAGTYNASGNTIASVTAEGDAVGLTVGQPLPSPTVTFNRYYVVVVSGGTGTSPAPTVPLSPPDLLLCNGTAWVEVDVSSTYSSQTAVQVGFTPGASVSSTNVQAAIEEVSNECRNANNIASGVLDEVYGGTGISSYVKGDLIVASGINALAKLAIGSNGQVLTADSTQATGTKWATPASGTVLSVNASAPLAVASGTSTPHITISGASTSGVGVVQLTNSVSTTSSVLAATATAVKSAYDLANAALPKAGGTVTGELLIGNAGSLVFEGATNDGFETTLTVADPTADRTITLPNVSGNVVTTGDSATVTNAMLAGSIVDTKLSTISTAGKVSNSATTATSANTVSAIVARDASGNFSAGTIDATIDDGTY